MAKITIPKLTPLRPYGGEYGIATPQGFRIRYKAEEPIPMFALNEWSPKIMAAKYPEERLQNLVGRFQALGRMGGWAYDDPKTSEAISDVMQGADTPLAIAFMNDFLNRTGRATTEELLGDPALFRSRVRKADMKALERLAKQRGVTIEDVLKSGKFTKTDIDTATENLAAYGSTGSGFVPEFVHGNNPLDWLRGHTMQGRNPTVGIGSNALNALTGQRPVLSVADTIARQSGGRFTRNDLLEFTGDIATPWARDAARKKELARKRAVNRNK